MSSVQKKKRYEPLINKTWRSFTMIVVLALGISVMVVPLVLLIPLLVRALDPSAPAYATEHPLLWLWITMTVIEMALAAFIIWATFRSVLGIWQNSMYPNK